MSGADIVEREEDKTFFATWVGNSTVTWKEDPETKTSTLDFHRDTGPLYRCITLWRGRILGKT